MPNTKKTNWKKQYEDKAAECEALSARLQEVMTAAQVLAKDKEQVERELSLTRTGKVAAEMQLEQIMAAIQSQQEAVTGEEDETGSLADGGSDTPSDGTE